MSKIGVVFLLALGITLHDVASIEGFHVPGLHALFFSVSIMLVCLLWERLNRARLQTRLGLARRGVDPARATLAVDPASLQIQKD